MEKLLGLDDGLVLFLDLAETIYTVLKDFYSLQSAIDDTLGLLDGNGGISVA